MICPTTHEQIKWVRQEDPNGCAIACCAMIVGSTYQELKAFFVERQPDAGIRAISAYDMHKFLEAHKIEKVAYIPKRTTMIEKGLRWPPAPIKDADYLYCSVQPTQSTEIAHAVLMLRDGTILDPERPEPVSSLAFYPDVNYMEVWQRK